MTTTIPRFPILTRTTWVVLISVCVLGHARAQNVGAETLFEDGARLMKEGKVAEACEAFEGSNRIEARAGTLIRLGECRLKNDQLASAWSAYRDALARAKDPGKRSIAAAKSAELEPRLSYLTVSVPDESRVDGLELTRDSTVLDPALWNRAVPVDGGTYTIAGKAPGHEAWQTTVKIATSSGHASVEVPRFKELAKLVPTPAEAAAAHDDDETRAPPRPFWSTRRELAVGVAGLAVASLAAGIVLGVSSSSRDHEAHALCPDPTACSQAAAADTLEHSARARAIGADVAFSVGATAAIAAGTLWWWATTETSHRVAIVPSLDSRSLAVLGRF